MYNIIINFETKEELDIFKAFLDGVEDFNGEIVEDEVEQGDDAPVEDAAIDEAVEDLQEPTVAVESEIKI